MYIVTPTSCRELCISTELDQPINSKKLLHILLTHNKIPYHIWYVIWNRKKWPILWATKMQRYQDRVNHCYGKSINFEVYRCIIFDIVPKDLRVIRASGRTGLTVFPLLDMLLIIRRGRQYEWPDITQIPKQVPSFSKSGCHPTEIFLFCIDDEIRSIIFNLCTNQIGVYPNNKNMFWNLSPISVIFARKKNSK